MPQTRFVLKKALEFGHAVLVVVNKIDRSSARPEFVINSTFELFIELNATDEQVFFYIFLPKTKILLYAFKKKILLCICMFLQKINYCNSFLF